MKVPEDRNSCLTLFVAEKKPALRFTKKGEVLKSTHEIAMEAIRSRPSPSRELASLGINFRKRKRVLMTSLQAHMHVYDLMNFVDKRHC